MAYPISVDYINKVEAAQRYLSRLPFVQYHPDKLDFREVQQQHTILLTSAIIEKVEMEQKKQEGIKDFKDTFAHFLESPLIYKGAAKNWRNVTDSILFHGDKLIKRLEEEGNCSQEIYFFVCQCLQMQQTILERMDDVDRLMERIGANRPYEVMALFTRVTYCNDFFDVSGEPTAAEWAERVKYFDDNSKISGTIEERGKVAVIWRQIVKEHPNIQIIKKRPNGKEYDSSFNAFSTNLKRKYK